MNGVYYYAGCYLQIHHHSGSNRKLFTFIKPRQGFLAITLCVCVSVCVSVNNIAQKVFNQSSSYLVEAFPLTQG